MSDPTPTPERLAGIAVDATLDAHQKPTPGVSTLQAKMSAPANAANVVVPVHQPGGGLSFALPTGGKPLVTGRLLAVASIAALALGVAAPFIPPPFGAIAGVLAMVAGVLAGLGARLPAFAEGRPWVPLTAAPTLLSLAGLLVKLAETLPSPFGTYAYVVAAILGAAGGKMIPAPAIKALLVLGLAVGLLSGAPAQADSVKVGTIVSGAGASTNNLTTASAFTLYAGNSYTVQCPGVDVYVNTGTGSATASSVTATSADSGEKLLADTPMDLTLREGRNAIAIAAAGAFTCTVRRLVL